MLVVLILLFGFMLFLGLGVLVALAKVFVVILRLAARLMVAAAASGLLGLGVGVGAAAFGASDPQVAGWLAAILAFPISIWALDRSARQRGSPPSAFAHRGGGFSRGRSAPDPEPVADGPVALAWNRAIRLAPGQRRRIEAAREACAYVLRWSDQNAFDIETVECAVLIRKRLPELVEQTVNYHELAGRAERREVIDAMVGDLESLGAMALGRVERAKAVLGESLAVTRAHIASRTDETPAF